MQFTSYQFLFAFAPLVVIVYWLVPTRYRYLWITLTGYLFYVFWDWRFSGLMLATTAIDYFCGNRISICRNANSSKYMARTWLAVSIAFNISLLAFFKYFGFLSGIAESLAGYQKFSFIHIVLPMGISFYTFKSIAYTIDVYKARCKPARSFLHYAAFVSFFPELLSGPIDRYKDLGSQLESPPDKLTVTNLNLGLFFFALGLVKKVLLADRVAYYSDPLWADIKHLSSLESWIATTAYSIQIYFDFAGYSLIAIGMGFLMGFRLPQNFDSPYRARDIGDFWRRWHMSLSFWFRDYLFFNIGGLNVNGRWVALFVTMTLCGFWHGASWTFLVWGAYHGILLIIHHLLREKKKRWKGGWFGIIGTFFLVSIGWVLFRSDTLPEAGLMLSLMLGLQNILSGYLPGTSGLNFIGSRLAVPNQLFVLIAIGYLWATFLPNLYEYACTRKKVPKLLITVLIGFLAGVAVVLVSDSNPFLYAQF